MKSVERLAKEIGARDALQKKRLEECLRFLTAEEKNDFEMQLEYLCEKFSFEKCVEGYLTFVNSSREEKKYFFENGRYRYSTFSEVDKRVYHNAEYMKKYILGLQISGYLWNSHVEIHRYFKKKIKEFCGGGIWKSGRGTGSIFARP